MPPATPVASALPDWLVLERLTPFDAYAQAMGTVMLAIALLQLLCSFYADARALRIFALVYLLTGIGWFTAHPRAHGGAADAPLVSALVAVGLLGLTVWGLYEYLGIARRRALALWLGTLAVGAGLTVWLLYVAPRSALSVYALMAAGFAYCAWLAWRAARLEGNVGYLYITAAFASYPLLFLAWLALPQTMTGFEMGYYAAVPRMAIGITLLAVSLIRARRRTEAELQRRIAAEDSLRALNATLEERVAARTGELDDLVAGLRSFNRNVSHDLRDPLAGIAGLARLGDGALDGEDIGRARRYLQLIQGQAEQMGAMVQDLLQLSRVTEAPLNRERQSLRRSVDDALQQLRLSAATAAALGRIRVELQPLPECEHDPDLMRLVFVNLLGNALKFSAARDGADRIRVDLRPTAQGAAVCVEDDGLGLPQGREAELFKPFVRLHGDRVPGSGVGLTIVRRIVEAHGGRVWAERGERGGARFLFTLQGLRAG